MFKKQMPKTKIAMLIESTNWIHTLFMKMPIDVVYLNNQNKVIDIQENLKTWKFCKPRLKAKKVLELKNSYINKLDIKKGIKIKFIDEIK